MIVRTARHMARARPNLSRNESSLWNELNQSEYLHADMPEIEKVVSPDGNQSQEHEDPTDSESSVSIPTMSHVDYNSARAVLLHSGDYGLRFMLLGWTWLYFIVLLCAAVTRVIRNGPNQLQLK